MAGTEKLIAAALESRLVIFAGAGVSMGAPTNLPSWRDVNRIVVRALAAEAQKVVGAPLVQQAADLVIERHEQEKLPPEYQAQVLAELLHRRYFEVLRHLDSDRPNATHLAIAWLAKLGCVRAIITTNFDRVIESAFAAVGAQLTCHFQPQHFRDLASELGRIERSGGACQLLKLHGSVDDSDTLIDTLAQRKRGFALPVLDSARFLLERCHWLFLGFSGLDLEAERNYLALDQQAGTARGFSWFVQEGRQPRDAVLRLKERYGERGEIVTGSLPSWLLDFADGISDAPRPWIAHYFAQRAPQAAIPSIAAIERGAADWAVGLRPNICSMALASLVAACAEPQAAAALVTAVLEKLDAQGGAARDTSRSFLLTKALATNALCILLGGFGRHEEAVHWGTAAVDLAREAGDPDTEDRFRGNVAISLETLGQIDAAREMYETALAGYRSRGDPAALSFGLCGLAAYLIRQGHLNEARELAQEARECAEHAGDERFRGIAINDLGIIAKLKGEYPAGLELFQECETLFGRLGNDEAVAAAACNRGEVLAALGRRDEARQIYEGVLEVVRRIERLDNEAATYLSLGTLSRDSGDAEAAEQWYGKAIEMYRRVKDPSNEAFALGRLAEVHTSTGQFDRALEIAGSALPLVSERNRAFKTNLLNQIGHASLKLGRLADADQAYREILGIAEEIGNASSLAASLMNLGTIALLQQRDAEAAAFFSRAAARLDELDRGDERDYCRLGLAAVTLDQKLATLSDEGHRKTDPEEQRAAAREMVALYPDLIAMYERLGVMSLVAAFCASAASTARFAGDLPRAVDWYKRAGELFEGLGAGSRARDMLGQGEALLKRSVDELLRGDRMAEALPLLLRVVEFAGPLGHRELCATSLLNAAIILAQTSQEPAQARELAVQVLPLVDPTSDDAATARRLIAHCDAQIGRS